MKPYFRFSIYIFAIAVFVTRTVGIAAAKQDTPPLTVIPAQSGIYIFVESVPAENVSGFNLYRADLPSLDEIADRMNKVSGDGIQKSGEGIEQTFKDLEKQVFGDMSVDDFVARAGALVEKTDAESIKLLQEYTLKLEEYNRLSEMAEAGIDASIEETSGSAKLDMLAVYEEMSGGVDSQFGLVTSTPVSPVVDPKEAAKIIGGDPKIVFDALGAQSLKTFVESYIKNPAKYEAEVNYSPDVNLILGRLFVDRDVKEGARYAYKVVLLDAMGKEIQTLGPVETINTSIPIKAPADLTSSVTASGVKLAWLQPEESCGVIGWDVFRAESRGDEFTKISPMLRPVMGNATFIDSTAKDGMNYKYKVAAINRAGQSSEASNIAEAGLTTRNNSPAPQAPAIEIAANEIKTSWTPGDISGGEFINIYIGENITEPFKKLNESPVPVSEGVYVDVTPKKTAVTYYYRLAVVSADGIEGAKSSAVPARIQDKQPPSQPQGLALSKNEDGLSFLKWEAVGDSDVMGYYIYRGQSEKDIKRISNEVIRESEYFIPLAGAGVSGVQYYSVSAVDKDLNESNNSEVIEYVIADNISPEKPTGLSATSGEGPVQLSWQPNFERDVDIYRVYRKELPDGEAAAIADIPSIEENLYIDEEVTSGIEYEYKITAIDTSENESEPSTPVSILPKDSTPPSVPQDFAVTVSENAAMMTWKKSPEADISGYRLLRSEAETGNFTAIKDAAMLPESDESYADDTVSQGKQYWYRIQAVDTSGNESTRSEPQGPVTLSK